VVILNFWATWCAPCRVEIPHLIALHEEWKAEGVRIVGVSVDRSDASVVRQFVEELGVPYPIVLDPEMDVARAYGGHYAFPTTFVIDREGRIHHRFMRAVGPADLRPAIAPLL
jgi:thiol-disulfide isomerase/thioredoxin